MKDKQETDIPIFGGNYKGIPIKSDSRVHFAVMSVLKEIGIHRDSTITCLDIATGKGALAQRLMDNFPSLVLDCNDFEDGTLAKGTRTNYCIDLNDNFIFNCKYDLIIAVEVIEHLENPFQFIRNLKKHLTVDGLILLTTPNTDSLVDRICYFFKGHPYYFGADGIVNSGGHITQVPEWLLKYIANKENMHFERATDTVDSRGLIGIRGRLLLNLLYPIRYLMKNFNHRSGTVCILKNK